MSKPNILLIQTDQQTAETLSLYGNTALHTPALEALAERGVVFEQAFCNYPACAPSRSSMFTGRYCSTLNLHANHMLINPSEVTLPQVLKNHGYQTAIIGKNHAFTERPSSIYPGGVPENPSLLHEVFDYVRLADHGHMVDGYRDDPGAQAAHAWAVEHCWSSPLGHGTNPAPVEKCGTYLLGETMLDYLAHLRQENQPFFTWLSFPDPHTPYQVPEPYASMIRPEDVPMPPVDSLEGKPERVKVAHLMDAMDTADEQLIRQVRAIHYGMIRFIDDTLAKIFERMDALSLLENTVIIFTSDHGDSMGAHGIIQKHNFFYDSFTHVPFIMSLPGYKGTKRTSNLLELIDIMPTLLELAGIPVPPGCQGKSHAAFLEGDLSVTPREYVVMESGEHGDPVKVSDITLRPEHPLDERYFVWCAYSDAWIGKGKAIRTKEWKLCIYANGEGELYDLKADPHELHNRFPDPAFASVRIELERKLLQWSMEKEDRLPINNTVKISMQSMREKYGVSQ
ncbi:sulfatase [Paenibacillus sp. JDR-2]|uniref:sulfatase family protein n=1 Tax=Paenibacillus sp. (strain JDR-2) TaxID=324057 RepID=UPI000166A613|nr:sulfatase-like hydrolase/transferase [Paenibacillus sp. JDR-2]ACT00370.1 sulfatase [Paenibacillus sp. JDR-2]